MLVLNRRVGEEIVIGDSIRIVVVDLHGRNVRLGFEAPREVPILRSEIHGQIQAAQAAASNTNREDLTCVMP